MTYKIKVEYNLVKKNIQIFSLYYFVKILSKFENTSKQTKFDIIFRAFMYYYNTI